MGAALKAVAYDNPTWILDSESRNVVLALFARGTGQNTAIFIITSDLSVISFFLLSLLVSNMRMSTTLPSTISSRT
eukprot:731752-Amphidinium_carterae.1